MLWACGLVCKGEEGDVGSFVQIFVQICEHLCSERDLEVEITISNVEQHGTVRNNPSIFLLTLMPLYMARFINGCGGMNGMRKVVDAVTIVVAPAACT